MSVKSKDISEFVSAAIYSALGGDNKFLYSRRDTITLTGTSGTASILNNGVTKTATFHTSPTITASDFVTADAADYLTSGVTLTSSGAVLIFTQVTLGTLFIGLTTITNLTLTLAGTIANADVHYPVYKAIPKEPEEIYIRLGEVLDTEDGTKDEFIYNGTIPVIVCDESRIKEADKTLARNILNLVRGVLKPTVQSVPSGFIEFGHDGKAEYIDLGEGGRILIRVIDIYKFLIQ